MVSPPCTVLIVENFLPDRELYRRCLLTDTSCGYRLLEVDTAMEGLELCRTEAIDAILLDYLLPDGDGLEFLQALHAQSQGESPPVVIVTGQGDEMIAVQAIKLGAEDYLVKRRLTPDLLRLTVRSAIENARLRLQLRESDDRFRVSIENMLDCFGIFSAIRDDQGQMVDFRMDYLNAAALQNNQMTIADIGKGLCEMLPAHRETGLFDEYCQVVETGEPLVKEALIYSDLYGTQLLSRAFDIRVTRLSDGFVASWRDVTARKQAELERQQQLERERILNQTMQQIRRSLNLDEVLNTAVAEVRGSLSADRTFIYRFNPDFSGRIVVESVSEGLPAAIGANVQDQYFLETRGEDYRQGRIQVVEDIYKAGLTDCHVEMLARFQIRANLVVPILQGEQLWGLLVMNQCACPRQWQPAEIDLLQQIAAQLGIALKQAELYEQARTELVERQRAEAALQQSHDRFELAAAAVNCLIYDWDLQRDHVDRTQGLYEVTGYLPEEADSSPQWWFALLHPDDRHQKSYEDVLAELSKLDRYFTEYRVLHKNGHYIWVEDGGRIIKNDLGQPIRIVGSTRDITERKLTEQCLRQSEEQLQLGVQVAGVALARFDYASNCVTLSPEAAALFGIPADERVITRDRIHATFHPDEREHLAALIRQVLDPAGAGYFAQEHRVVWQNGEVRWLSVRKQVFFDRSGAAPRPKYAILAAIDITDKKATEATLRESEAHLRYTVELNPQVPWMADSNGRITRFSDRWLELTGMTREQALGDGWVQAPHPDDHPAMVAKWTRAIATGEPYDVEHRIKLADGSYRWMRSRAFPRRSEQGEIVQWYGTTEDIDDRKQIEFEREELLQREQSARAEAEAANQSKDEFVALVAHELRSPLNAILGWARLMQTRQLDPATTARALETIARNTQAQVQLVEDLLDVSRMVRGTLKLTLESVNLLDVIESAIETVRPTAETKQLQLNLHLAPTAPIHGDSHRLQQIVLNLLTNAIKFTPSGGGIEVRLEQVDGGMGEGVYGSMGRWVEGEIRERGAGESESPEVSATVDPIPSPTHLPTHSPTHPPTPPSALITVTDTGKGISADFLPQVFQRFRQDQQNATAKEGLGLGLAIVKYLVDLHGGTVTVTSGGEGQGATFTVRLPLVGEWGAGGMGGWGEVSPIAPAPQPPTLSLEGVRVLLVDDQPDMLDLTAFALREYGAIVETANSAAAALEKLPRFKPQILLSDIAMPQQDGYELLQRVRRLEASGIILVSEGQIPAIALTAFASEARRDRAFEAGFQEYLTKPIDPEQLVITILSFIQKSR